VAQELRTSADPPAIAQLSAICRPLALDLAQATSRAAERDPALELDRPEVAGLPKASSMIFWTLAAVGDRPLESSHVRVWREQEAPWPAAPRLSS
jgi:hypothetical protein